MMSSASVATCRPCSMELSPPLIRRFQDQTDALALAA